MKTLQLIYRDKNLFLPLIEQFLAAKPSEACFSDNSPVRENTQHWLRLVVVTKGKARFQLSSNSDYYQRDISDGGLAVVLPSGYLEHWPIAGEYWNFQCIFRDNFIRLLYANQEKVYWYHTSKPICASGRNCLRALMQLGQASRQRPECQNIIKAIYNIVHSELLNDQSRNITKSMETYYAVEEYLAEHFNSPQTNRDNVAKALKLSPQHISRLFKEFSEEGFNARLRKLRLDYAISMLDRNDLSVDEIAYMSGYSSAAYFIKEFRKMMGVSPGRYRRNR